ncbi:MAG: aldehyde dehydrogenase family protein, partial [Bacteroidota bacterium]
KIIMKAAAAHLTSVTLELGGKSPTIIDKSANLDFTVRSVAWIKHYNNGQTCIAPDYVLIHSSIKDEFIKRYKATLEEFYTSDPKNSKAYSRVVNEKHYNRLSAAIEDAKTKGAIIESGGHGDDTDYYISPTLLTDLPEDTILMNEEIFGPILPVKTYDTLEGVINYVNSKEKPLALYIFSRNKKVTRTIIKHTRAGTTGVNSVGLQFVNPHLPFGGSNNSGIGKAHGYEGFKSFSNARSVLKHVHWGPIAWFKPPYTKFIQKLADLTIKWF